MYSIQRTVGRALSRYIVTVLFITVGRAQFFPTGVGLRADNLFLNPTIFLNLGMALSRAL